MFYVFYSPFFPPIHFKAISLPACRKIPPEGKKMCGWMQLQCSQEKALQERPLSCHTMWSTDRMGLSWEGEKGRQQLCQTLTARTFAPATVAGENVYSSWYMDGKMLFIT